MIESLEIGNFRSYGLVKFDFNRGDVVLLGENGVGKSNLLEAIHYMSILRSFRGAAPRELVKIGERGFVLRGRIAKDGYSEIVELEKTFPNGLKLLIDGSPVRRSSDFIREFRAVVFAPEDKAVTAGSSACRRKFFDMLISVMEPEYLEALQHYGTALAQRNAALRNPSVPEMTAAAFEPELARAAAVLTPLRHEYQIKICDAANHLFGHNRLNIAYLPEYPEKVTEYQEKLARERGRDKRRGYTSFGPQTDEFELRLDGRNLRSYGSNGQLRLTALFLKMAEFVLVKSRCKQGVIALVDDVTGELDANATARFFELLSDAGQRFFTFTELPGNGRFDHAQILRLPI